MIHYFSIIDRFPQIKKTIHQVYIFYIDGFNTMMVFCGKLSIIRHVGFKYDSNTTEEKTKLVLIL